jgi:transcriptional regulator of acetoin/glycerol metabolism
MSPLQTDTATLHSTADSDREPRSVPQLFCALEGGAPSHPGSRHALDEIDEIRFGRAPTGNADRYHRDATARRLAFRISDRWLSSEHAQISLRGDEHVFVDLDSKNGSRVNGVKVASVALRDGDIIELGQTIFVFRARGPLPDSEPSDFTISPEQTIPGLASLRAPLNARFSELGRIAVTEVPVAILGETGTGKELVARAVHAMSRRKGEFIAINCGAIPRDLAASELFGHRKGSFTGASTDKAGLIAAADQGTVFLDEIGELPLEQQVVLLRVLQDRRVTPVGGTAREIDFRLVVATNRDMASAIAARQFRDDLWARASGFVVRLPPLRERREDLGLILATLLARLRAPGAPEVMIRSDAASALFRYAWPLNVRELELALRSAIALCQDDTLTLANLPEALRALPTTLPIAEPNGDADPAEVLDTLRQEHLRNLLQRTAGNLSEVARLMGKRRTQIQRWIKRYGIDPGSYRAS